LTRGGGPYACARIGLASRLLTAAQCKKPCGIAKVMHSAELAWRSELAATTLADLTGNAPPASARRAKRWLGNKARPGLVGA
jgi:DNA-binding IscR family transcriptional regulator